MLRPSLTVRVETLLRLFDGLEVNFKKKAPPTKKQQRTTSR